MSSLVADPLYPQVKEQAVNASGLTYYRDKDASLAGHISHRLSSVGVPDCASYLEILRDPVRGASELQELVAELTIGETYFFRHTDHFDALRSIVVPDLIARNRKIRSLRIWCAGCADGPEPYSMSILLKREFGQSLTGWDVRILGTDVNQHSLARARQGRFEKWAFRSTPEKIWNACFTKEGSKWRIAPEYKEWVSFEHHNLVEHPFPCLQRSLFGFDLIVCRNVMIYFGPALMRKMIGQFFDCLSPDGWFLVGPAEPNMVFFTAFRLVNAPGVVLYRKPDKAALREEQSAPAIAEPSPPARKLPARSFPAKNEPPPKLCSSERSAPAAGHTLADVRHHADRGEWKTAVRFCEQLLENDQLNPTLHFYHGLVLEHMGEHTQAEKAIRRAMYLDRKSVLPHYYLGLLLRTRNDNGQALRSFGNALQLLEPRPDSEVIADADGMTVIELKKLIQIHISVLRGQS